MAQAPPASGRAPPRPEEILDRALLGPHFDQRPYHVPNHVAQESRGGDAVDEIFAHGPPRALEHPSGRILGVAVGGAEGAEIVLTHERDRRLLHRGAVEGAVHVPRMSPREGRGPRRVTNTVFVRATARLATRIEIVADGIDSLRDDSRTAQRVEPSLQPGAIDRPFRREGRHLTARMHAGIRATRRIESYTLAENRRQHPFERALNCGPIRLNLPAVIVRPVVFENHADAHGPDAFSA